MLASLIPGNFQFQLTQAEKADVVANCDHIQNLKFSKALPFAFTEHGAIQAANVVAIGQAVVIGIYVVRLFVQFRKFLDARKRLSLRAHTLAQSKLPVENRQGFGDFDSTSNKINEGSMKVSKGLEFPVVALPCVGHMPAQGVRERGGAGVLCGGFAGYAASVNKPKRRHNRRICKEISIAKE